MSDELKGIIENVLAKAPTCTKTKARLLRKRKIRAARLNYVAR